MNLFVFGLGYSASHFVREHRSVFSRVIGTVRSPGREPLGGDREMSILRFDGEESDPRIAEAVAASDALLVSVQPGPGSDPVLQRYTDVIAGAPRLRRIVYLSTIGVYGDHGGAWIDESAATQPDNARQEARVAAENAWLDLARHAAKTVFVLRLAGIYGPGRNALRDLRAGEARRIDKPGQVFNRIHVTDIGRAVAAALHRDGQGGIINVTDDEPAPATDVVSYAAGLMGVQPPPLLSFATADLSPMARSFYAANRRVANTALKRDLGVTLAYPTYRAGLDALWAAGEGRA
ncbi:SDR family oxidoreductase [Lichenifustis flavocetrariae]|uniref:SDR family oxidoreductase n=1 Tax=Lichenifustis flavocetrariae TaxID=2949735 RepID=A0AA41YV65_9HYPH|nr:SDR family oxidoreductase [Lichenifustis flavocetrariae]MCW6507687.1 SDR family oxidoreductase [Lichenifustis flavocetrariae]